MSPYEELANAIVLQAVKDYRLHDDEQELAAVARLEGSALFHGLMLPWGGREDNVARWLVSDG